MLFMVDNYDSFTYNLVQYLSELGAEVQVGRNDQFTADQIIRKNPVGIVLSPGPGRPEKAGMMLELIEKTEGKIPIFGVCLGHQAIAQFYGAEITYAPYLMHGKTSEILHDKSAMFEGIESPFTATRYHSLIVNRATLSDEFIVSAWTEDDIIMGIRHKKLPLHGVQFHPESIMTPCGKTLLNNFIKSIT